MESGIGHQGIEPGREVKGVDTLFNGIAVQSSSADRLHKLPRKQLNVRLDEGTIERIRRRVREDGTTMQDTLEQLIGEALSAERQVVMEQVDPRGLYPLVHRLPPSDRTHYVTCWAPKGGTGKTTVAVGLGHQMAWGLRRAEGTPARVLVIDFDEFADAAMLSERARTRYGIASDSPPKDVRDLYENLPELREEGTFSSVSRYLSKDEASGLFFLLPQQSKGDEYAATLDCVAYEELLAVIAPYFDVVIFDCGPHMLSSLSGLTPFALSKANATVLAGDQTFQTVTHTAKFFDRMSKRSNEAFVFQNRYAYVLNQYNPRVPYGIDEVTAILGKSVSTVLPIPGIGEEAIRASYAGQNIIFSPCKAVKLAFRDLADWVVFCLREQVLAAGGDAGFDMDFPDEGGPAIVPLEE